eukprot:4933824-Alexandrium_andersonii.AAC.1
MSASLVGSEMCIRDRHQSEGLVGAWKAIREGSGVPHAFCIQFGGGGIKSCLLYTSDAADDM